jgi:hypothetical protein
VTPPPAPRRLFLPAHDLDRRTLTLLWWRPVARELLPPPGLQLQSRRLWRMVSRGHTTPNRRTDHFGVDDEVGDRSTRAGRNTRPGVKAGVQKETQVVRSARAAGKRAVKAALVQDAADRQQMIDAGEEDLAHDEDERQIQDDAEADEMRNPVAGYAAARAQAVQRKRPVNRNEDDAEEVEMVVDGEHEEGEEGEQSTDEAGNKAPKTRVSARHHEMAEKY